MRLPAHLVVTVYSLADDMIDQGGPSCHVPAPVPVISAIMMCLGLPVQSQPTTTASPLP